MGVPRSRCRTCCSTVLIRFQGHAVSLVEFWRPLAFSAYFWRSRSQCWPLRWTTWSNLSSDCNSIPSFGHRKGVLLQHDNGLAHRERLKPKFRSCMASKFCLILRTAQTWRHPIMVCFDQSQRSYLDNNSKRSMRSKAPVTPFLLHCQKTDIIIKSETLQNDVLMSSKKRALFCRITLFCFWYILFQINYQLCLKTFYSP